MYVKLTLFLLVNIAWAVHGTEMDDMEMHPYLRTVISPKIPDEIYIKYWKENARKTVAEKIAAPLNRNVAKNVIFFMGDGMSIPTMSTARVYMEGEEYKLSFEKFPYTGLSKTYAVDGQVADCGASATACLCGVKANFGTLGVGPELARNDCLGQSNKTNHVFSIGYYSQLKGKKTGFVTTERVTDATPGGLYAHVADQLWESDTDVTKDNKDPSVCKDIATQLVYGETGKNLDVIFGGGRDTLLPNNVKYEDGKPGQRSDGVNLIDEWVAKTNGTYVSNRDQLLALNSGVDKVLGLFAHGPLNYNLERNEKIEPSLEEMTKAAIKVLEKGDNGYFLLVESALIDWAHHATEARVALNETAEFSKAIEAAVDLTNVNDTLIVVTADHSFTLSYSGYPIRGNNIFGLAENGSDGRPYSTLSYANGPGYKKNIDGGRYDITADDMSHNHYKFPAYAPRFYGTHAGEDVAIFARGPWAHLFSGVLEQHVIPHLMSFASCVGENTVDACNINERTTGGVSSSFPSLVFLVFLSCFILTV